MFKTIGRLIAMPFIAIFFGIVGFFTGLYFPWDDCAVNVFDSYPKEKFHIISIPGRIVGMVVCSIIFSIGAFAYGCYFAWTY